MATVVLDTGALIALERGDRRVGALLYEAARNGVDAVASCACVAQAWRDPARQARLVRALAGILEVPLDESAARRCGNLLGRSSTSDVADAATALLASPTDVIVTSDPDDIRRLVDAAGTHARVQSI
jgi:predicted nucleic acid-binding protein